MTIKEILKESGKKLKNKKNASASLDAEVLLSFVLKKPRSYLYIWPDKKITKKQEKRYNQLIKRRLRHEPVAYLVKNKEFYGLDFYVDKNILIPRPETETLVDTVIKLVAADHDPQLQILDLGTGSGCIAITLKKCLPKAKIFASDISKKALAVAKKNAKKHKVKIIFKQGNLLEPFFSPGTPQALTESEPRRRLASQPKFDIIVANLPYLTPRQMKNKTIQAEPKAALSGGQDGLDYYRELLNQVKRFKYKPLIFLEIDPGQTVKIRKIIRKTLPHAFVEIKKDLD